MEIKDIPIQESYHVKEVKDRITKLFNNQVLDRIPLIVDYVDLASLEGKQHEEGDRKIARAIRNHEFDLEAQLNMMKEYLLRDFMDDRILFLIPYAGTGTIASIFGCKTRFLDNASPWTEHIIESADDIDKLKPDIKNADVFNLSLEKLLFFQKKVGNKIPIGLPDIQSPMDTAGIVMEDTELFTAMYTHPKKVHKLLELITETIIEGVEIFKSKIENLYSLSHARWLPYGIHMSDDYLAVLSPQMYEEFAVPYNEIIAKEFKGVFLHSCGNYLHQVPNLLNTKGLLGVDFHEFPIRDIVSEVKDKFVLVPKHINNAFMTFQKRANKTKEELKILSWQNLNDLERAGTKRFIFRGECFEKERLKEYFEKACEKAKKLVKNSN